MLVWHRKKTTTPTFVTKVQNFEVTKNQRSETMKVVALISGGKDSCFNMMQCIAAGHEIIALAN